MKSVSDTDYTQVTHRTVILLPMHPASFTHNFVSVISASPRMQWYCRLVMKNSVLDS